MKKIKILSLTMLAVVSFNGLAQADNANDDKLAFDEKNSTRSKADFIKSCKGVRDGNPGRVKWFKGLPKDSQYQIRKMCKHEHINICVVK